MVNNLYQLENNDFTFKYPLEELENVAWLIKPDVWKNYKI